MDASEAIRNLADYTDEIVSRMRDLAVSYNVKIIAGSIPEYVCNKLRNCSYLCRRDGTPATKNNMHNTPDEPTYSGMKG